MMMHRYLLIVLLTLITGIAGAQKFNGGILLGGNVSQVDGDTWAGYHKFGFQAGGLVGLRISPHSSFQMELEFFQKGSRKNADSVHGSLDTYLLRLNYIEIPILYQYTFAKRYFLETGPAVDILFSYKEQVNGFDETFVPLRTVTLAGILGFGGYITKHLKADFRFNYSLLSIRNGTTAAYRKILFEVGQFNNVMALTLYWEFKENENLK